MALETNNSTRLLGEFYERRLHGLSRPSRNDVFNLSRDTHLLALEVLGDVFFEDGDTDIAIIGKDIKNPSKPNLGEYDSNPSNDDPIEQTRKFR